MDAKLSLGLVAFSGALFWGAHACAATSTTDVLSSVATQTTSQSGVSTGHGSFGASSSEGMNSVLDATPEGAADPLTVLRFEAARSDGNTEWEDVISKTATTAQWSGEKGYFSVYAKGYGDTMLFFKNNVNITSQVYNYQTSYYTDSSKIIYAFQYYYSVPLSVVSSGDVIKIQSTSRNFPWTTYTDTLTITSVQ